MGGPDGNDSLFGPAVGNLHGQYNFQSIAIALVIMKDDHPQSNFQKSICLCSAFGGAVVGQLLFGYIGDWVGRNKAMFLTNLFCVFGATGSAIFTGGSSTLLYTSIAIWRFFLGMGVGGVYPLSATNAAENTGSTDPLQRRKRVSWAFFWQVPGSTLPFLAAFILARLFPGDVELQWRLTLGLGAIPAAIVMAHSLSKTESKEFQAAKQDVSMFQALRKREYWKKLVGTGGGWFCYDIVHYGPYLIAPVIIADIFDTQEDESVDTIAWQTSFANMIGVPGVLVCIGLYKYLGTKRQQFWGFLFIALSFILMALCYKKISDTALFFLFCIMTFGINSGPSVTTFVLPSESYPSEVRSTFSGLSAATGKTGATTITFIDYYIMDAFGMKGNLYLYAVIAVCGAIITMFFVDDIDSGILQQRSRLKEESSIAKAAKHTEYV